MPAAPSGWQTPKTTWVATDAIGTSDMNRIEGNANATELGNRVVDPTQAPTGNTGTLRQMLDWLANRIGAIIGGNWYSTPPITLAQTNAKFDASTGHKHTGASGDAPQLPTTGIADGAITDAKVSASAAIAQSKISNTNRAVDADKVDSYDAGNASGQVPVSNGTVCSNLNADMVDGQHLPVSGYIMGATGANKHIEGFTANIGPIPNGESRSVSFTFVDPFASNIVAVASVGVVGGGTRLDHWLGSKSTTGVSVYMLNFSGGPTINPVWVEMIAVGND